MVTMTSSLDISEDDVLQALSLDPSTHQTAAIKRGARASSVKRFIIMVGVAIIAIVAGVITNAAARAGGSSYTAFLGIIMIAAAPIIILVAFVALLRKPRQDTAVDCLSGFYKHLLGAIPDYGKAYRLLSPTAMKGEFETANGFTRKWKANTRKLTSILEDRLTDEVVCSQCGSRATGIWSPVQWQIVDKELSTRSRMLQCDQCGEVVCPECYLKLDDRRTCRKCSKSLRKAPLRIVMNDPELLLLLTPTKEFPKVVEQKSDRVVDLVHEFAASVLAKAWAEDEFRPMGEPGSMVLRVRETAVLNGNRWYLMGGDLGPMTPT